MGPSQHLWPYWMTAKTAARFVDEPSVRAFRRACGKLYPRPVRIAGKGERWLADDLRVAIDRLAGRGHAFDAADVL